MLGLRCCEQAFSGCGECRLLYFVMHGLLIVVTFFCRVWVLLYLENKGNPANSSFKKCVGVKYIYQKICHVNHFKHTGQWH